MRADVTPEPESAERAAILRAVAALAARSDGRSDWWRAGAAESARAELEDPRSFPRYAGAYAGWRPRRSRGAMRA